MSDSIDRATKKIGEVFGKEVTVSHSETSGHPDLTPSTRLIFEVSESQLTFEPPNTCPGCVLDCVPTLP